MWHQLSSSKSLSIQVLHQQIRGGVTKERVKKKIVEFSAKGLYINDVIALGGRGGTPKDDTSMTDDRYQGGGSYHKRA